MSQIKKSNILKEYRKSKTNRPADLSKKIMEITRAGAAIADVSDPIVAICVLCDRADNCSDNCDALDFYCGRGDGFWCITQDIS